jgi:hypothetical protein
MNKRLSFRIVFAEIVLLGACATLVGCGPQPGPAPTAAPVTQQDQTVLDKIRDRRSGKARRGNNPPAATVSPTAP